MTGTMMKYRAITGRLSFITISRVYLVAIVGILIYSVVH